MIKNKIDHLSRKEDHWEICLTKGDLISGGETGFEEISFKPVALSSINFEDIFLKSSFLGFQLKLPFFISCMTGGSSLAAQFNRDLAQLAENLGIPMGLGSHKVLFYHPEKIKDFQVKNLAPSVPIFSNIGVIQLKEFSHKDLHEINKKLEVQAQVVHLNALQEICQPKGDRNFKGIKEALLTFIETSPIPIIVKETGAGIRSSEIEWLLNNGVEYVDIAGCGGTNWGLVESYRQPISESLRIQNTWKDWGVPSAYTLEGLEPGLRKKTLTSGGMQEPLSACKALSMGTCLVGFARSLLVSWKKEGKEGLLKFFKNQEKTLRELMVLIGVSSLDELKEGSSLVISSDFKEKALLWK